MEPVRNKTYKRVMTIAGSDPSGGAGVQIHSIPDDTGTDAVKIGMLHSSELIHAVRNVLDEYPAVRDIVLDPVMVATSGDPLLQADAVATLRDVLIPRARVITPNIPEAELLLGRKISSQEELPLAARELASLGASVLLKAGHLTDDELTDIFCNAETGEILELRSRRVATPNTHGTGCTGLPTPSATATDPSITSIPSGPESPYFSSDFTASTGDVSEFKIPAHRLVFRPRCRKIRGNSQKKPKNTWKNTLHNKKFFYKTKKRPLIIRELIFQNLTFPLRSHRGVFCNSV